jgi:hypothetical protein
MRLTTALVFVAASLAMLAGPADAAKKRPVTIETVTGRVAAVDMTHVVVGRMNCLLGPKTVAKANTFAVGENVTIRCIGTKLAAIVFTPVTDGHALPPIHIAGSATKPTPSSLPAPAVVSSVNVHGAITALTPYSASIGDATCDLGSTLVAQLWVGEVIGMGCKTFADGSALVDIAVPIGR